MNATNSLNRMLLCALLVLTTWNIDSIHAQENPVSFEEYLKDIQKRWQDYCGKVIFRNSNSKHWETINKEMLRALIQLITKDEKDVRLAQLNHYFLTKHSFENNGTKTDLRKLPGLGPPPPEGFLDYLYLATLQLDLGEKSGESYALVSKLLAKNYPKGFHHTISNFGAPWLDIALNVYQTTPDESIRTYIYQSLVSAFKNDLPNFTAYILVRGNPQGEDLKTFCFYLKSIDYRLPVVNASDASNQTYKKWDKQWLQKSNMINIREEDKTK